MSDPPGTKGAGPKVIKLAENQKSSSQDPDMVGSNTVHGWKDLEVLYQNCEFHGHVPSLALRFQFWLKLQSLG